MSLSRTVLLINRIKKRSSYLLLTCLVLLILVESSILLTKQFGLDNQINDSTTRLEQICIKEVQDTSKLKCWDDLVDKVLQEENGLDKAFLLIARLYKQNPEVASNCHAFIHKLGERGYSLYSVRSDFKISSLTSTCGYGFYHGFMETLLTKGGTLKQSGEFCDWAAKQVAGKNDIRGACFHGIGHGITEDHEKKTWLNEKDLVDKPLGICQEVTSDNYMIDRCSSGVFNVLAIKYGSGSLLLDKQDPLRYCKSVQKEYLKKPCFEEMNTMLISISGNDFIKAAKFLNEVEDKYAVQAMRSLASVVGLNKKPDYFPLQISNCRDISSRLRLACIGGFVVGLIEGEVPNSQETKALSFCKDAILQEDERVSCYKEALWLLSLYMPSTNYTQICSDLDNKYKQLCQT